MFKYFFAYYNEIPKGKGFPLFGIGHITVLLIIFISIFFLSKYFNKQQYKKQRSIGFKICLIVFGLELVKMIYLMIKTELTLEALPFHLCSMAIYISLYNSVWPGEIKQEILYSLCMPGALSALIFPAWAYSPLLSLISLQSFIQHALLFAYPLILFTSKNLNPNYRNLPKCLLFLLVISAPIYLFNKKFDTNFLFINYPIEGSPLILFEKWFGDPGYIFGIFLLILTVWVILYVPILKRQK